MSTYTAKQALVAVLALAATTVSAIPLHVHHNSHMEKRDDPNFFNLHVHNNCGFDKSVAIYQISPSFEMIQVTDPTSIPAGGNTIVAAPYTESGLRLSGHAEWPIGDQWNPQALFEFGYSTFNSVQGTAYDLSVMEGSDSDIGISASPIPNGSGSSQCPSKSCSPSSCALDQGWTNEDQVNDGSPADTVCYKGRTAFKVTFCPSS